MGNEKNITGRYTQAVWVDPANWKTIEKVEVA